MVLSDRHYGGVKYPKGGIGRIAETVAEGEAHESFNRGPFSHFAHCMACWLLPFHA